MTARPSVGVVGHVEQIEFAVVERLPPQGHIVHARETFVHPGGGGAVAAVQLRRMAGASTFLTALGDDDHGRAAAAELRDVHGVDLHVVLRPAPTRRGFVHLDDDAERTITVLGERLAPAEGDDLPWGRLAELDGVYFTAGDVHALRAARAAGALGATPRARATLREGRVRLDALIASANDPGEQVVAGEIDPPPRHLVLTDGGRGGTWRSDTGEEGRWQASAPPGPPVDAYGAGDSFAAGVTYGLAAGWSLDRAVALAARCGAACLSGRGPYGAPMPDPDTTPA